MKKDEDSNFLFVFHSGDVNHLANVSIAQKRFSVNKKRYPELVSESRVR